MNPSPYAGRLEQLEKRIRYRSRRKRALVVSAPRSRRHRRAVRASWKSVERLVRYMRRRAGQVFIMQTH